MLHAECIQVVLATSLAKPLLNLADVKIGRLEIPNKLFVTVLCVRDLRRKCHRPSIEGHSARGHDLAASRAHHTSLFLYLAKAGVKSFFRVLSCGFLFPGVLRAIKEDARSSKTAVGFAQAHAFQLDCKGLLRLRPIGLGLFVALFFLA